MSLPGEAEARARLKAQYAADFADTDAVLQSVVKMLSRGHWHTTNAKGLSDNVFYAMLALLV
ncbi:MAG: hypothetical protein GEU99_16975 [Luteitalea sp.]|nr:hypothetical protein [Luteitalea sp.]